MSTKEVIGDESADDDERQQIKAVRSLGLYTIAIIWLFSSVAIVLAFILPVLNYQQISVNIATKVHLRMLIFQNFLGEH